MAETNPQPSQVKPDTHFDWAIYTDATFAGLSILIPIPGVDWLFEQYFRRRMPRAIAKRNGQELHFKVIREVNHAMSSSCRGCLMIPVNTGFWFLKRMYRTMLYVLTVKESVDLLGLYWHRAFLLDYMIRRGDLATMDSARVAARALNTVLANITTSPLTQLAKQVIGNASHVFRTIWKWVRRRKEDDTVQSAREQMATAWNDFDAYLREVAVQYEEAYQQSELWFKEMAAREAAYQAERNGR